jgi:hypothetical protein
MSCTAPLDQSESVRLSVYLSVHLRASYWNQRNKNGRPPILNEIKAILEVAGLALRGDPAALPALKQVFTGLMSIHREMTSPAHTYMSYIYYI